MLVDMMDILNTACGIRDPNWEQEFISTWTKLRAESWSPLYQQCTNIPREVSHGTFSSDDSGVAIGNSATEKFKLARYDRTGIRTPALFVFFTERSPHLELYRPNDEVLMLDIITVNFILKAKSFVTSVKPVFWFACRSWSRSRAGPLTIPTLVLSQSRRWSSQDPDIGLALDLGAGSVLDSDLVPALKTDADSAAEGEAGGGDTLTCGACRRAFALADIVRFIQHKVSACDKDLAYHTHCYSAGPNSDPEDGPRPGQVSSGGTGARRPSLLTARRAPSSRVHTPPLASPSIAAPDLLEDGGASSTPKRLLDDAEGGMSTPKRRASTSPMPSSSPDEDIKPKIKQEQIDTSGSSEDQKKSRTEVVDAESNTMHSGKIASSVSDGDSIGARYDTGLSFVAARPAPPALHNNNARPVEKRLRHRESIHLDLL
ncbi:hypothetical protein EVAR_16028_1 [Eumeta japonica]|uniref:BCL-11A-like CCHC zinc finger domain-containing protein n=1 Tax=Eumeta variegata TaxID=151549 RepID=A0A4C1VZW5_EUMVA|nr:hypothetical protein EVAR_16028_1 [Eumeta japonica]